MEETQVEVLQSDALQKLTKAETENQVDIAKRYPRDLEKARKNLKSYAAPNKEVAESCFYTKPVGKDKKGQQNYATGPSIRMAETMATVYGNIKFGSRVIDIGDKFVTVQGIAMDMENNLFYTAEETRSIYSEKIGKYPQHLIQTTIKAAGAFAVRDAIFKVIPLGLFASEIEHIKKVGTGAINPDGSSNKTETLEARAKRAVDYFVKQGITRDRIFEKFGISAIKEITEDHLVELTGIRNANKDGEIDLEEAFPATKAENVKEQTKEKSQGSQTEAFKPKWDDKESKQ